MPRLSLSDEIASLQLSAVAQINASVKANPRPDIISLTGGEPDIAPLPGIFDRIGRVQRSYKYSPIDGYPELRELLLQKLNGRNEIVGQDLAVLCCSGGCGGLFLSFRSILNDADEVLIPDPCWEYMPTLIQLAGGRVRRFRVMSHAGHWEVDLDSLSRAVTTRTRAVLINTPLNPVGLVHTRAALTGIAQICAQNGLWIVSDEVTETFVYGSARHVSVASLYPHTLTVHSFSKTYGLTGLRFGYLSGPRSAIEQAKKVQLYTTMYPSSVAQEVAMRVLEQPHEDFLREVKTTFEKKSAHFAAGLRSLPGVEIADPDGGLFVFPKVTAEISGAELQKSLLEQQGLAVAPGSAFGTGTAANLRMFVGAPYEIIDEAVARLGRFLNNPVSAQASSKSTRPVVRTQE
jgi:aspartate/methionine/tyrosine aminotransferase